MSDGFAEYSSQSWFGRIGDSLKGVLCGGLLVVVAVALLFWNEGRAARRTKTLAEGAREVVTVSPDRVAAANEGKLVHLSGTATTDETLSDPEFGVSANALKLERVAEMFQWREHESSSTEKNLGGSTTTKTTYSYQKEWSSALIESGRFKHPEGHQNPAAMAYASHSQTADKITVGAFRLSASLAARIDNLTDLPLTSTEKLSEPLKAKSRLADGRLFVGADPASPQIGDQRLAFKVALPTAVSLVARQVGESFEPGTVASGGSIELLQVGTFSAQEMFAHARQMNALLSWGLRLGGWLVMLIGFSLLFKPLSVLADLVPFIGTLVGMGTGLLAFLLATPLSLMVVAVAWIAYRPLLGVALLAVAVAIPFVFKGRCKKPATAAEPLPAGRG